jgi:hypothetical protein
MSTIARVITLALVLICAGRASAQACDDGRVRVSGHCCWPGQRWSRAARVCDGVPQCPSGMSEEGESCVVRATATASTPSSPTTGTMAPTAPTIAGVATGPAVSTAGWPIAPGGRPNGVIDPVVRRGTDLFLAIAGGVAFGAGYLMGVIAAPILASTMPRWSEASDWPIAFVPVIGAPVGMLLSSESYGGDVVLGSISSVLQIVGLSLFLDAVCGYTLDIESGDEAAHPVARLRLVPSAPGAQAGLGLVLEM